MGIQNKLEAAINTLVDEFIQAPYRFFTEADAVARFHQLLDADPAINRQVKTKDDFTTGLVHREYPTCFRFSDKNPTARLGPPASRGHYDTVILNPEFVAAHSAATVINRDIRTVRDETIIPFQAVVEFKLDNKGWSAGRSRGAIAELGKLRLSHEAPLRYFVVLMRYCAPNPARWEKYWPRVSQAAAQEADIGSIFAVQWLSVKEGAEVFRFGRWSE
jgi:hypothetical protein